MLAIHKYTKYRKFIGRQENNIINAIIELRKKCTAGIITEEEYKKIIENQ